MSLVRVSPYSGNSQISESNKGGFLTAKTRTSIAAASGIAGAGATAAECSGQ